MYVCVCVSGGQKGGEETRDSVENVLRPIYVMSRDISSFLLLSKHKELIITNVSWCAPLKACFLLCG